MVCALLRVCAVKLEPGEHLQSEPQIAFASRQPVGSSEWHHKLCAFSDCPIFMIIIARAINHFRRGEWKR